MLSSLIHGDFSLSGAFSEADDGSTLLSTSRRETPNEGLTFITDYETASTGVRRDAAKVWPQLSPDLQLDKNLILEALRYSPTLPSKSEFERQFSQALRFDADIVLAFARRDDFVELYHERHLFVPHILQDNKQIMMEYCSKIHRSLQNCSPRLADDKDVVHQALSLDGMELQYASLRLQQDAETVQMACLKDGRALEFCPPGPLRLKLTSNREFMEQVFTKGGAMMYRNLPPVLKQDRALLMLALKHGLHLRYVPSELSNEKSFLVLAVELNPKLYLEMNKTTQSQPQIARAALMACGRADQNVGAKVHQACPTLFDNDYECIKQYARVAPLEQVKEYCLSSASLQILQTNNYEVIGIALQRDSSFYFDMPSWMQLIPHIALVAVGRTTAFRIFNRIKDTPLLRDNVDIASKIIKHIPDNYLPGLQRQLPASLFEDRSILKAWIQRNMPIPSRAAYIDRQLALDIAEYSWHQFRRVGVELLSDLNFMKEAVQKCGLVLRFTSQELQHNMDLACRAVANDPGALENTSTSESVLVQHVTSKLQAHEIYVKEFLRGISVHTTAPSCPLQLLDCGEETSEALKRLIAEFLDVPIGEELSILLSAWSNLQHPRPRRKPNSQSVPSRNPWVGGEDEHGVFRRRRWGGWDGEDENGFLRRRRFLRLALGRRRNDIDPAAFPHERIHFDEFPDPMEMDDPWEPEGHFMEEMMLNEMEDQIENI